MKRFIQIGLLIFIALSDLFGQRIICPTTLQKYKNSGLWAAEGFAGPKDWSGWTVGGGLLYFIPRIKPGKETKYIFPGKFIRLDGFYLRDRLRLVEHEASGVDLMFGYTPFNVSDVFYGSILVGITYSNDKLTSPTSYLNRDSNVFKHGVITGMEMSVFLSRNGNLSIVGSFTQRSLWGADWGHWRWYATLGLRYHFIAMRPLNEAKQM